MRKNFSLVVLFIVSLFILSAQTFAQAQRPAPTIRVNERIQQTIVRNSRVDLAEWLRVARSDARHTEILNITVSGQSFVTGELEISARGRLIARMAFNRQLVTRTFSFPVGTLIGDVEFSVKGEVFVESIGAIITDLRAPAPRPGQPAPRR